MTEGPLPPAGWYADPSGAPRRRWWDGTIWTEHLDTLYSAAYAPPAPVHEMPTPSYGTAAPASAPLVARPVGFGEAIARGFTGYVDFRGTASRSEYWWWTLFTVLVSMGASLLDSVLTFGLLSTLWALAVLLPGLAVAVRRLRDAGYSWAFLLLALVPFVGGIVLIVMLCQQSVAPVTTAGPGGRQYGVTLEKYPPLR